MKIQKRYHSLDTIRGITLISMILYHTTWDLVYLYQVDWQWYHSDIAYLWQQSICWTFIFLSGFCWSLGRHPLRRGLTVFAGGAIVSAVTLLFMPEDRVLFGILTMTGSSMLLMIPVAKLVGKGKPELGLLWSMLLFILTRNVNRGTLGFEGLAFGEVPRALYANMLTTYVGFPYRGFFSTDYFSVIPWFFLFLAGYFMYHSMEKRGQLTILETQPKTCTAVFDWCGRHSLELYMIHQPVVYALLYLGAYVAG